MTYPEVYRCGKRVMIRMTADLPSGFRSIEAQLDPTAAEEFVNAVRDVIDDISTPPTGLPTATF